jgi:heptosyltransferase-2
MGTDRNGKRILIVSVNWLGDILFMTPAIRAIRRAFPKAYIACLVPPYGKDLLVGNPHLDEVILLREERGLKGWRHWGSMVRQLKAGRFDEVYLFHRSFTRTMLTWLAGIPVRIGYRTGKRGWLLTHPVDPPHQDSLHKVEGFLNLLRAVGIPEDGRHYDVQIFPEDERWALALLQEVGIHPTDRWVALHPGANWRLKRWPLGHFAQLADGLRERYQVKPLFIGGPTDVPLVEEILRRMKVPAPSAAGRTHFRQLAALLKRALLLISNDSGPLHLGMAVGIPVIGLFGPTDPKLTGPPVPVERSAESIGHAESSVKAEILFGSIGCPVPCYRLDCPVNLCMHQITVDAVLKTAKRYLS